VSDRYDRDDLVLVVDAVDDSVRAAPRGVTVREWRQPLLSGAMWGF